MHKSGDISVNVASTLIDLHDVGSLGSISGFEKFGENGFGDRNCKVDMRVMLDRDTKVKQDKIGFISLFDNMLC